MLNMDTDSKSGTAGEKFMTLLRRYRLAAGMTQAQLAQRLGIGPSSVSFWESGTTLPSPEMYPKLARVLGVDAMELTRAVDPEPQMPAPTNPK